MLKPKFFLLIVAVSALTANAQRATLTAKEHAAKKANMCAEVSFPLRTVRKDVIYNHGQAALTEVTVIEAESHNRIRETFSSDSQPPRRQVVVTYGNFIYEKLNDGPWEKMPWHFRHGQSALDITSLGSSEYWIERMLIDGRAFTVLGNSEFQEIGGKSGYRKNELFIASSGDCKKNVTTYGLVSPRSITRQVSYSVEHDSSIKIVAPIK
jgi:hypothetical protein